VLGGTYDLDAAARRYRSRADAQDFLPQFLDARKREQWSLADAKFTRLLSIDPGVASFYAGVEYKILAIGLRDQRRAAAFGRNSLASHSATMCTP